MKSKALAVILLSNVMVISSEFLCSAYATDLKVFITDPYGNALYPVNVELEIGGRYIFGQMKLDVTVFEDLDAGKYEIACGCYGYTEHSDLIEIKGDLMEYKIVLRKLCSLEVFLTYENGKVPDELALYVQAILENKDPRYLGYEEFTSHPDQNGKADFSGGIPEGYYNVAVVRKGGIVKKARTEVIRDKINQLDMVIPSAGGGTSAIPAFPFESIMLGLAFGIFLLWLFHRK